MSLVQLISTLVPTINPTDSGNRVLDIMEENHITQLPIIVDDKYVALLQENDILEWEHPESNISESNLLQFKPAIQAEAHPFEAFRLAHQMQLNVLPVINSENKYLGAITPASLVKYFTENSGIDSPGGIIILEILPRNYSMYQIARICENEDVQILTSQVQTYENGVLEVTLKLNKTNLGAVISSFERHEYAVKAVYGDNTRYDDLMDNYRLLMNYLNM